jgi:microsomal dipeptidase-like Zn-dependent dipeptidase
VSVIQGTWSRRRFIAAGAAAGGAATASLLRAGWADETSQPRTVDIVAKTIGIDTHNHIDVPMTPDDMPGPDIELAGEMTRSGLTAICMTFATDYQAGNPNERFQTALTAMDRQLERNQMQRSLSELDIRTAHSKRKPTVIQAVEGAHFLEGHLNRVEVAYDRGLRHLGLLPDSDAPVPLGDVYTNPPRYGGLTPFGAEVIRECNRLGILIDLAHASMKTTADALKVTSKPVMISHTGPDWRLGHDAHMAEMMRPRLISKEQASLVATAGGLIGIWTHLTATPLEYAQNLRAMADEVGVDHVCIGTDTKLTRPAPRPMGPGPGIPRTDGAPQPNDAGGHGPNGDSTGQKHAAAGERTNLAWEGETGGFYFEVVNAMLKTGFSGEEIRKIGGENYLSVFGAAVK